MVYTYTGTPGSGKSLHCADMILFHLKHGKNVICNFPINLNLVKKKYQKNFLYLPDSELTPHYLFEFAKAFHKEKKESQTYLIIDEAQRLFPIDRVYERRKEWEQFFQLHRHWGFSIILVTQNMSYINKGIRIQTEYEVKHRKVGNYGIGGLILTFIHIPLFVALTYWQGTRERIFTDFLHKKKKLGKLYDTFGNFDTDFVSVGHEQNEIPEIENEIEEANSRSQKENLDIVFGEEEEEIDLDSTDFDEENFESWDNDCNFTIEELHDWRIA